MDCISSLPDEILGKILSSLPTKVAASTSVLSKRWRNLLRLVDTLCFDESSGSSDVGFYDFVDKTFALLTDSTIIKKLSLSHVSRYSRGYDGWYSWIWTAMEQQRGLLELHLHYSPGYGSVLLERQFLTSNTLVKLTLSGEYWLEVENVFFPALKSLSVLSVLGLDGPNYCRLLDGCPVLEELFVSDAHHKDPPCCGTHVVNASVKRLKVFVDLLDSQQYHNFTCFEAPSLVYLDYSSYVYEDYRFVLDSLVEARLSLKLWDPNPDYDYYKFGYNSVYDRYDETVPELENGIFGDITNLVAGITNVTTLHLSPDSLEAFHFCCKSMPMFNNLLILSIESNKELSWQVMPLLLKSCPNLHTLVIKGLVHRVTSRCGDACACNPQKKKKKRKIAMDKICCLWTCQVKVLEVSEYGGSFEELKQMKHFLGNLRCLDTVKVGFDVHNDNNKFLRSNLLALPRVSSKCNIHFI